jgi:hypothetical protein
MDRRKASWLRPEDEEREKRIDEAIALFEPRYGRPLTRQEGLEIYTRPTVGRLRGLALPKGSAPCRLTGFYSVLLRLHKRRQFAIGERKERTHTAESAD